MITNTKQSLIDTLVGLSTDTKPTQISNGSLFYEMDTKKLYIFSDGDNTWYEVEA